eukprot:3222743-Rhodomonas_salina.1
MDPVHSLHACLRRGFSFDFLHSGACLIGAQHSSEPDIALQTRRRKGGVTTLVPSRNCRANNQGRRPSCGSARISERAVELACRPFCRQQELS